MFSEKKRLSTVTGGGSVNSASAALRPAQPPAVPSTNAAMVFARVALLLAGGAAVKFILALQDEDDAARAGDARDATDAPVDRRLGRVRPAVSRREPAAGANAEAAPGPVAAAEHASSLDSTGPGASALTPAAAEAEETRALDETRDVAVVAVEATHRTELDQETRSTGPPEAVEPEAGHAPPPRVAVRAVTFASPEPSLVSHEPDDDRHALSSSYEDDDDAYDDDAVASRVASEYLASLPFVLPPGAAFPETPGVGARRPAVCASPFIAADGARRVIRGEGGKGAFVRRNERGGAAARPPKDPSPVGARAPAGARSARTPGPKTADALAGLAYPKTPGPTLDDAFNDETLDSDADDAFDDENEPEASPPGASPRVKLHVSLEDLKGRYGGAACDESRERYRASPLAEANGNETGFDASR